jgi:photosystem I protein
MTSPSERAKVDVPHSGNPPYPFRTVWALLLLAVNFVVAAYYFGILK